MHGQPLGESMIRRAKNKDRDLDRLLACTDISSDQPQHQQANVLEESRYSSNVIKARKDTHGIFVVPGDFRRLM